MATALLILLCLWQTGDLSAGQDELLDQARVLRRAGRSGEAARLLGPARAARPGDPELDGLLGLVLLDAGRADDAVAVARDWARYDGDCYRIHVLLARVAERNGDDRAALASWRRAGGLKQAPIEALVGQINTLLRLGKPIAAQKKAELLITHQPALGQRLLAETLVKQGEGLQALDMAQLGSVIKLYRQAHELLPDDRAVLLRLADALLRGARIDEARELLQAQLSAPPDALQRAFWSGRCFEADRDHERAREAYLSVLELEPSHAEASVRLARIALHAGEYAEARQWLQRGRARLGDSPRVLSLSAEIHLGLDQPAQAEAALRRVLEQNPQDAGASYQLARALYAQGRREDGDASMARFLELQRSARNTGGDEGGTGRDTDGDS